MNTSAVVAITLNPALDITITIEHLSAESTLRIPAAQRRLGGKGLNVANVAAEQGYTAVALGPICQESLQELHQRQAEQRNTTYPLNDGVHTAFTPTPTPLRSTYAIHQKHDSSTTIINENGAEHPSHVYEGILNTLEDTLRHYEHCAVTLSGSFPPAAPTTLISDISMLCQRYGSTFIVDTSGQHLLDAAQAHADYLKPNYSELLEATQSDELFTAVKKLQNLGAQNIIVSCSEDGLYFINHHQAYRAKLAQPLQGNPTGAGDALVAALATGLIDKLPTEELLRRAICWSASALTQPIAGAIGTEWESLNTNILMEKIR
ncbi:1-phosphofructokinase family hexose kinase [Rothia sp. P7208]|uniref:1-phosphofructokinase family hexose kinase n=1 Tax=Rothia sp. P7208 TaxID=3402660 RepID=UPI003AD606F2